MDELTLDGSVNVGNQTKKAFSLINMLVRSPQYIFTKSRYILSLKMFKVHFNHNNQL